MRALPAALAIAALVAAPGCGSKRLSTADNAELYEQARLQIQAGKPLHARKTLGLVGLAEPVSPELDPLVKLAHADAYFFQGGGLNTIEAQSRYQQFLNFYPTHPRAPYAQYQLGECLLRQSEAPQNDQDFTKRAIDEFRKVAQLDPRSPYARAALARQRAAEDKLGEHEWLVARFYANRKSWTAVISRLRDLLDSFPAYSQREKVYLMLGRALIETGAVAEGRIYLRKLVDDNPGSDAGAAAKELLARTDVEPRG